MFNFKNKQSKVFVLLLALVMLVGVVAPSATLAAEVLEEDIIGITFEDAKSFTLIGEANDPESNTYTVEVRGLSPSYKKVDLEQPNSVTWDVEDETADDLVIVTPKKGHSNIATITIDGENEGYAKVVANYDDKYKVHSNVFVEPANEGPKTVENITVKFVDADNEPLAGFKKKYEIETLTASDTGLSKTLTKTPTVMHALDGAVGKDNIEVNESGFIEQIKDKKGGQEPNFEYWTYTVKHSDGTVEDNIEFGPGVYKLETEDTVTFKFAPWTP